MDHFLLTDPHYRHKMLVEAFHRPEGFEDIITANWKKKVKPEDILICLGDLCWGGDASAHDQYITHMPGTKWLVRGNHDRKSDKWYLEHGWNMVCEDFTLKFQGQKIRFSHMPKKYYGQFDLNIHGHFHNSTHRSQDPVLQGMRNLHHRLIALEYHGYGPILLKEFLKVCDTQYNLLKVEAPCYPLGVLPGIPHSDRFHAHMAYPLNLELFGEGTCCEICQIPLKHHYKGVE